MWQAPGSFRLRGPCSAVSADPLPDLDQTTRRPPDVALASYARPSEDDELEKMCRRIQARALERCGELLKQVPASKGGRSETRVVDGPS